MGIVFVGGVIAFVAPCLSAGPATAASYDVWSCRGPLGQPLSSYAWKAEINDAATGEVGWTDDCATGGSVTLGVTDTGIPANRKPRIDLRFNLPRGGQIAGYTLLRSIRVAGGGVPGLSYTYAAAVREQSGGTTSDNGCASFLALPDFNCGYEGNPAVPNDPANELDRPTAALSGLSVWAACLSIGCDPPFAPPAAEFKLFSARVAVVDNLPPAVSGLGGSITGPDPVTGTANLFVQGSDSGGGIASMSLSIDGSLYDVEPVTNSPTCVEPYEVPEPCPTGTGLLFPIHTELLTPGPHTATGEIVDAAGNSTPFGPVAFEVGSVDPGPPPPDNGNPAVTDPILKLDRGLIEHQPKKPASVTGSLRTTTGQPVVGAKLAVTSTEMGSKSSRTKALPAVVTGSDGRFRIPTSGAGVKQIEVSFAPVLGGPSTLSATATVRSKLKLTFKARPKRVRKGRSVRFSGQIVGGGPAVAGSNVEIQAIFGGRWRAVENVTARGNGRFKWKYRFKYVDRNALFSFRALVRSNPGWPWPSVKSKKIKVRISVP